MIDQNELTTNDIELSSPSIDSGLPAIKKYKANPNRKKREARINPEYEAAIIKILSIYKRKGFSTKSAIVEHIFQNKSFNRNECDIKISDLKSHLSGYKRQCVNLYDYYMDSAITEKDELALEELKKFTVKHKLANREKVASFFHKQFVLLTENMDSIIGLQTATIEDDSPEIQAIKDLFSKGDIQANLTPRRNIAYRLDNELDYKYFGGLKGKQNSGENRRVLEQVLIHNTHFMLETSNRTNIKYLQNWMDKFNEEITFYNTQKSKKVKTGIQSLYDCLVKYNNKLTTYKLEVLNDNE